MHWHKQVYNGRISLLLIWGGYLLMLALNVIFHEPWRDEFHSWNIARVSDGLLDLIYNKAYEGHGIIWYKLCWLLTRFTESPTALVGMHYLIVALASGIFVMKSPFSPLEKVLVLFGYFFLFEYATLARNYSILIVMLWAYCHFRQQTQKWMALGMICLMPFTQIYGMLFGLVLGAHWLWENRKMTWQKLILSTSLMGILFLFAFWEIKPPADGSAHARWYSDFSWESISYALAILWEAFVPIPQFQFHFWNTNILELSTAALTNTYKAMGGILILIGITFSFFQKNQYRFLFLAGVFVCLAFAFAKFHGYARHHGHVYVWFWVVLWVANQKQSRWQKLIMFVLLSLQLIAGLYASLRDWQDVFSPATQVACYLQDIKADANYALWLADPDYLIEPIGAICDHELYFPKQEKFAFFPQWDKDWGYINPEEVLLKAQLLTTENPILLVLGYEVQSQPDPAYELRLIKQFAPGIEASERFWLYELRKSHGHF